jgi:hypothetical protein
MWLCRDEQDVTVVSHNKLLFVLCTKYHDMGAAVTIQKEIDHSEDLGEDGIIVLNWIGMNSCVSGFMRLSQ